MTAYTWQLGIDWNAVETAGVSYLRGGLLQGSSPSPGTHPVQVNDTVTFVILDITSSGGKKVAEIGSFVILTQAAVTGQTLNKGLSSLQPTLPLRFLLTTQVQAIGTDGVVRLFNHDPEMVVGPNG
jgi:predicted RNA-binding protein with TRAM domain